MTPDLPTSAEALLRTAAPRGRALYRCVRSMLDDLEEAAPWTVLYAPPSDTGELRARLDDLLHLIEEAPNRVAGEIDEMSSSSLGEEEREALREAEFYFGALHQMVVPELHRLRYALEQMAGVETLPPSRADFYCELGADLKGKYSSAIMGAAAALASEGRWLGWEVEAVLFPEKSEEGERNRSLLAALESTVASIEAAIRNFPWREVLSSWRRQQHVDRYALGDLVALRGHLLRLLVLSNRRALYSGDYHQLQGREILLGSRLRELETLHLRSLDIAPTTRGEEAAETFARLHQLLLEVAALLDVDALRELIGDELLGELRHRGPVPTPREGSAGRLDALALLVVEEDLKIFLKLLVGAVKKRSSIAHRDGAGLGTVMPAFAQLGRPFPVERRAERRAPAPPVSPVDGEQARKHVERLHGALARLTHAESSAWRSFLMVQKLQMRLRVVPPALMAEMKPFLSELGRELLPLLDQATAAGAVPPGAAETLRGCHQRLTERDLSGPESALDVGGDLARVTRLLDSLEKEGQARLALRAD